MLNSHVKRLFKPLSGNPQNGHTQTNELFEFI